MGTKTYMLQEENEDGEMDDCSLHATEAGANQRMAKILNEYISLKYIKTSMEGEKLFAIDDSKTLAEWLIDYPEIKLQP